MIMLLIISLLVLAIVGLPNLGYHAYGWGPSGLVGIVLIVFVILLLFGRL